MGPETRRPTHPFRSTRHLLLEDSDMTSRSLRTFATLPVTFALLPAASAAGAAEAPTFSKDVAPIFFEHCSQCHRPGEVAPMSLLTYKEARPWAKSIARQVENRDMPPWSGESDRHVWANDISLSDKSPSLIWSTMTKLLP